MSKPSNFILSTDFATLKNSDQGLTATITVPGSTVIAGSASAEWHADIPVTAAKAIPQAKISSSKNSSRMLAGNSTIMTRTGTSSGSPSSYDIYVFVYRTSVSNIRLQAVIQNPYTSSLTGASGDEVFSVYLYTFIPPFS